jgi:fused signal recognition particle receptor
VALRTKKPDDAGEPENAPENADELHQPAEDAAETPRRRRLRDRLSRSRAPFGRLRSRGRIDDELWDDLEETLLLADVGVETAGALLDGVRARAAAERVRDAEQLPDLLAAEITQRLVGDADRTLAMDPGATNVWLLVGVNGVGKTTTVAKLAAQRVAAGQQVLLAAADTFRAAAADQLTVWADQLGVAVVRGTEGADPGSIVFDAVESARARAIEVVIVDTAGRLHTKVNLMEELKKIRRVIERTDGVLQEVLLVLDASTGQNGIAQAREFTDAVGVTGVVLTKLDGTSKGGVVLAVEAELGVRVKLVGVGESAEDLLVFDPAEFADALTS